MTFQTLSELLVLFLLIVSCARVFFIHSTRSDPVAALPIVAFLISVLNVLAYGVNIAELLVFLLSFFVFIWNIRALLRFNSNLVIDHYGPWFIFISIINLILILGAVVLIILFRPARVNMKKYQVEKTSAAYTGTLYNGFAEITVPWEHKALFLTWFKPSEKNTVSRENKPLIVFVPDECSSSDIYEPFMVKLAHDGYTVCAADIFAKDYKWFNNIADSKILRKAVMRYEKLYNPQKYAAINSEKDKKTTLALNALIDLLKKQNNEPFVLVGDGNVYPAFIESRAKHTDSVAAIFDLSKIESNTIPCYGPVDYAEPLFAWLLKVKRDDTMYLASHLAIVLENSIKERTLPETLAAEEPVEAENDAERTE